MLRYARSRAISAASGSCAESANRITSGGSYVPFSPSRSASLNSELWRRVWFLFIPHDLIKHPNVAFGLSRTRNRAKDGLFYFMVPEVMQLLKSEQKRKLQRRKEKNSDKQVRVSVFHADYPKIRSKEKELHRRQRKIARTVRSEMFVDRSGCGWYDSEAGNREFSGN